MEQKILDCIEKFDNIIILRHERPDEDAYGSQCGLAHILKASFADKNIYVAGEEDADFHYLARLDIVDDEIWQDSLVIVTDTANLSRIDDKRYTMAKKIIKIDHHPNKEHYGDLSWVDTSFSSTSEMIFHWFWTLKNEGLICPDEAARLLYAGIVGDTGRFLYGVSERTFRYVSELIEYSFTIDELYLNMYDQPLTLVKLNGYILENITMHGDGVATVFITEEIQKRYNVLPRHCARLVYSLGAIKGIKVWALFVECEDQIRVNIRSKGPEVHEVAGKYNGGGHPRASGAKIADWEEANNLIKDLVSTVNESKD